MALPPPTARPLPLALLLALVITLPRALLIHQAHNETSDEDYHLVRGLEFLHRDGGLIHRELNDPPLGQALTALPLALLGGTTHGPDENTALYAQSRYTPETALLLVTIWRTLLFLPLVAVAFCWTRELYGPASAWLAAAILLVEPTITAHLHLASLDVLATTGIVTACYLGWRYTQLPTTPRLLAASFATAVALLLKHTAIVVPLIQILYLVLAPRDARGSALRQLPRAVLYTVLFLWALLLFDVSPVRNTNLPPLPGGLYLESMLDAARHVARPNDAYLFGEIRRGGWWYYFPVVATYKVPLGLAALLLLAVLRRPRRAELALLIPATAYTAFMLCQSINIGWRHFLPAYTFLLLLATRSLAPAADAVRPRGHLALASLAMLFTVPDVLRYHPDYLAYVNLPRASPHLAISDSNVDWGQALKQTRGWLDANPAFVADRPVHLRAVCTTNRAIRHYLGARVTTLYPGDRPPTSGILVISPVALAGLSESTDEYAFLRAVPPSAVIGHTMRVYDLGAPSHGTATRGDSDPRHPSYDRVENPLDPRTRRD